MIENEKYLYLKKKKIRLENDEVNTNEKNESNGLHW